MVSLTSFEFPYKVISSRPDFSSVPILTKSKMGDLFIMSSNYEKSEFLGFSKLGIKSGS